MRQRYPNSGFTLIELIMVIAILAIISTLGVSRFGNMQKVAAKKVSISNQQMIGRAIETYVSFGGKLNKFDSLVDAGTQLGSGGFDFSQKGERGVVGGIYRGADDDMSESVIAKNDGICDGLAEILCEYAINKSEARALHEIGLKYVAQFTTYAHDAPSRKYTCDDSSIPMAMDGLDPALSACIMRSVTNGMIFAAVNPKTTLGRLTYQDCGQDLVVDDWPQGTTLSEEEIVAEVKETGGPLLALGLGSAASIIGAGQGGLDATPYSEAVPANKYRQYIVLIRLRSTGSFAVTETTAEFAGVLDPEGNTVRKARHTLKN